MLYNIYEIDCPWCARAEKGRLEVLMAKRSTHEAGIERNCAFCELGTVIVRSSGESTDVICEKHGIVRKDYICRNFRYDLLKREPQERPIPEISVASGKNE
jgi:hypothetical protein